MEFRWTDGQFVGGALCLDFANTVIYQTDPVRRHDRLQAAPDLAGWARHAGLAAALDHGAVGGDELARARALRADIDGVFRAAAMGGDIPSAQFRQLIKRYHGAMAAVSLVATPAGLDLAPAAPLLPLIAQSAVALALSRRLTRIKACAGCGWLFIDGSKGGRRRWCDMRTCGNRAKARRHYRRTRVSVP